MELRLHRTDCAGRAVREDALARLKAAVLEQPLPRGEPEIGRLAPTVKSTSPGNGARLHPSMTYSARVPSRCQSARPNTRCPTDKPVVPYPRAVTTPATRARGSTVFGHGRGRSRATSAQSDEVRRIELNDDVVYRCLRLGRSLTSSGRLRGLVRYHDRLYVELSPRLFVSLLDMFQR